METVGCRGADNIELLIGALQGRHSRRLCPLVGRFQRQGWSALERHRDRSKTIIVAEKLVNGTQILEIAILKTPRAFCPASAKILGFARSFCLQGRSRALPARRHLSRICWWMRRSPSHASSELPGSTRA